MDTTPLCEGEESLPERVVVATVDGVGRAAAVGVARHGELFVSKRGQRGRFHSLLL